MQSLKQSSSLSRSLCTLWNRGTYCVADSAVSVVRSLNARRYETILRISR